MFTPKGQMRQAKQLERANVPIAAVVGCGKKGFGLPSETLKTSPSYLLEAKATEHESKHPDKKQLPSGQPPETVGSRLLSIPH